MCREKKKERRSLRVESLEKRELLSVTECCIPESNLSVPYADVPDSFVSSGSMQPSEVIAPVDMPTGTFSTERSVTNISSASSIPYEPLAASIPLTFRPDIQASRGGKLSTSSVTTGNTFNVTLGTLKNVGKAKVAAEYKITIYASSNNIISTNDIRLGSYTVVSSLAAGKSTTLTCKGVTTDRLTTGQTYYIGWIVTNVQNETVTNNNAGYCSTKLTVKAPAIPNLEVSNGGKLSVSSITKGGTFDVKTGTVKNIGGAAVPAGYQITVYASSNNIISTNDIRLGSYTVVSSLAAGRSTTINLKNISTTGLSAGQTYYIGWIMTDVRGETVTVNNTGYCPTTLTIQAAPVKKMATPTLSVRGGYQKLILTWECKTPTEVYQIAYRPRGINVWTKIYVYNDNNSKSCTYTIGQLNSGVSYEVSVKALTTNTKFGYTNSDWSTVKRATVASKSSSGRIPNSYVPPSKYRTFADYNIEGNSYGLFDWD